MRWKKVGDGEMRDEVQFIRLLQSTFAAVHNLPLTANTPIPVFPI